MVGSGLDCGFRRNDGKGAGMTGDGGTGLGCWWGVGLVGWGLELSWTELLEGYGEAAGAVDAAFALRGLSGED